MSLIIQYFAAVNQNIIQIHNANNINIFTQNLIDVNLKNR